MSSLAALAATLGTGRGADAAICHVLATDAGRLLVRLREAEAGAPDLGKQGDRLSHQYLMSALAELRPDDAVLSEEGVDDSARTAASRVWIVDPLDGTREYGEQGRTDWAVHVALWSEGSLIAGAVALPALGTTLSTNAPTRPTLRIVAPPRLAVSRTRPPEFALRLGEALDGVLVPMGSAGAKVAAVVRGEADIYVHAGGQWEWDSAAPVAVAVHHGMHASRVDGSPLIYNSAHPYLPDLLVCRPELADGVLAAVEELTGTVRT